MIKKLVLMAVLLMLSSWGQADTGDIPLSSNFQLNSPRALDARTTVADATARNAIAAINRYNGLTVFQRSDNHTWQLQGGTSTWVDITASTAVLVGSFISNQSTLQSGAVLHVSSGTILDFYASTITMIGPGPGQFNALEGAPPPATASGRDILYADSGAHWFKMLNNGSTGYLVIGSSTTGNSGSCAQFSADGSLVSAGAACGPGTGGASTGTITSSAQHNVARYSVVGTSNVIVGSPNLTNDATTVRISGFGDNTGLFIQPNAAITNTVNKGALVVNNSNNTDGFGLVVYSTAGTQGATNGLTFLDSGATSYNEPMLWIRSQSTSTIGGNVDINIHANNPDIEFRELDKYNGVDGVGQWEIAVNNDNLQLNNRNAANSAFQTLVSLDRTTGLKFKEMDGNEDYVSLRASTTLTTSHSYVLPSGAPSSGQLLGYASTVGSDYNLAWADQLTSGSTSYIQNRDTLQTGSTFYVSSGTVNGQLTVKPSATGSGGIVLQAMSGQTADLLIAYNSSGEPRATINAAGQFTNPNPLGSPGANENFGVGSGAAVTTGSNNTAIGYLVMSANTTGGRNTAVGRGALAGNVSTNDNTAVGYGALAVSTATNNTAIGSSVMQKNTTGNGNTAVGKEALEENQSGSNNVGIGYLAGWGNSPTAYQALGSQNTFIGYRANVGVSSATALTNATAIGADSSVNASNSLVLGATSLSTKVGIGNDAPATKLHLSNGMFTIDGAGAGITFPDGTTQTTALVSTGSFISLQNTLQTGATFFVSSGTVNGQLSVTTIKFPDGTIQVTSPTAGGAGGVSLSSTNTWTADQFFANKIFVSTALPPGISAGNVNTFINGGSTTTALLTGTRNFMLGAGTGWDLTSGGSNVCIGNQACNKITTDASNVAVGDSAYPVGKAGSNNTIVGSGAMNSSTTGNNNTGIGRSALYYNTTGSGNTALGYQSCLNSVGGTALAGVICLGDRSRVDTSNTMAVGSVSNPINDVYMNGVNPALTTNGLSVIFHAQASSGTNATGGNFTVAAGQGSGTGVGGTINFQVAPAGASGAAQNALATILSLPSTTAGSAGKAMCWKTATTLGYCSSVVDVVGACTCN